MRGLGIEDAHPVRVVVSGALSLPRDGYLAQTAREIPLWLCHDDDAEESRRTAWSELGAELIEVPFTPDAEMDLPALLQRLGERGLTRVLCEGGGRLAAALIEADLVDEIVCYTAGVVLGDEAIPVVGGLEVEALQLAPRFRLLDAAPDRPRPAQPLAAAGVKPGDAPRRPRYLELQPPSLSAVVTMAAAAVAIASTRVQFPSGVSAM